MRDGSSVLHMKFSANTIWLTGVALPLWSAGKLDSKNLETTQNCLVGIVVPLVIAWGYVLMHYVKMRGEKWI